MSIEPRSDCRGTVERGDARATAWFAACFICYRAVLHRAHGEIDLAPGKRVERWGPTMSPAREAGGGGSYDARASSLTRTSLLRLESGSPALTRSRPRVGGPSHSRVQAYTHLICSHYVLLPRL